MLKINGVSKTYAKSDRKAVDSVTLSICPGEIFGFIGPNGAGKTTTIKMIAGILPIDEGSIVVNGFDVVREPINAKMSMGFVPDSHDIYERLTGMEYLGFMADMYGVSAALRKERIDKYLAMFEMENASRDVIKSYSHGMKQKLIVTGALIHEPPLWILDEPLTGLDPRSAHCLKEEMREHCRKGYSVFFSTHVLEVAEKLCHRIAIIDSGRIAAMGTMEELEMRSGEIGESLENIFLQLTE